MGCQRLTYHQKYTSKTESTPIFLMGGKQRSDYQVFGVQLDGRSFSSDSYRYGFNGMEKDDEVKGSGNSLDFGARMYDPRIGRWLSLDAAANLYPSFSDYSSFANNPILFTDPDGNVIKIYYDTGEIDSDGKPIYEAYVYKSKMKKPNDKFVKKTIRALNKMYRSQSYDKNRIVKTLTEDDKNIVSIMQSQTGEAISVGQLFSHNNDGTMNVDNPEGFERFVTYDPNVGFISVDGSQRQSPAMTLLHELGHQYYILYDPEGFEAELAEAIASGKIAEYYEKMEKAVGDYDEYSDRWIIQNVENPVKREGNREDHNTGFFLKTKGGVFSKRGNEKRRPGKKEWEPVKPKKK